MKVIPDPPANRKLKRAAEKVQRSVQKANATAMKHLLRMQQQTVLPQLRLNIIRADVSASLRKRKREESDTASASSKRVNTEAVHRSIAATATTAQNQQTLELEMLRSKVQQLECIHPQSDAERSHMSINMAVHPQARRK